MFIARITQSNRTVFFNVNFGFECLEQSFVCAWSCIDASNLQLTKINYYNCFEKAEVQLDEYFECFANL